jgi:allophanate hydrolase subunit 2
MGYRLTGNEALKGAEILTSPVQPGTIQLTPSGQLIVLMKDGQTTGGYARILQLSETSLSKLAQKRPGDIIKFIF